MKKRFVLFGALLLAVSLAITVGVRARGKNERVLWRTAKVTRTNMQSVVTATGTLQPVVTSPVGAQVSGIVWKLHADFNSHVEAGEILVELEPGLFRNAVMQAAANLGAARANAARLRAQAGDAVRTRDRSRTLAGGRMLPQADADTAQANVEATQAAVDGAQAAVLQATAQLERTRLDLAHSVIHSPVTGTVISRNVDVGQAVASSFTAPTLFLIAEDLAKMYVHANVDEADIGQLHVGQQATFTVDTFRGRRFAAAVYQIRNAAQTVSNVVTYDVVMTVENPDLLLRPGMTANVSIVSLAKSDVLAVPAAALRFRPPGSADVGLKGTAGGGSVYTISNDPPERVPVEVGISDGVLTEVSGIAQGEEVIIDVLKDKNPPVRTLGNGSGRGF